MYVKRKKLTPNLRCLEATFIHWKNYGSTPNINLELSPKDNLEFTSAVVRHLLQQTWSQLSYLAFCIGLEGDPENRQPKISHIFAQACTLESPIQHTFHCESNTEDSSY